MAIFVGTQAQALSGSQWETVRGYVNSYYGGPQSGGGLDGEAGFRMGKTALWDRLDSTHNIAPNAGAAVGSAGTAVTGVLGEGDDMAYRPVLIDNLSNQGAFIPGTEFRCNWNVDGSCFSDGSLTAIRQIVDNHKAAGFSTDIVDYCVSSQTAGPSTGGFGIIAQVPGALSSDHSLTPKVYIADYSRNGWRNNLSTASGAEAKAAPETLAGGFAAPSTVASCDASANDYDLVRCQANWAISATGGNVGGGQMTISIIAGAGQSVDVRSGTIETMSSGGVNLQVPINSLFSISGLANLDPTKSTVLASRTQMGETSAIGLKMLGYNTIAGGSISTGISRWNGTLGEAQIAYGDGLPLQNVAALSITPASSTYAKVDTTGPSVSSVNSSSVTATSADINRSAGEPATMKVEYGTASGVYTNPPVNDTVLDLNKTVSLPGLIASTTYYYKVTSYDGYANGTVSTEGSFTTATDKAITGFTIPGQAGPTTINESAHTVALSMPYGTDVTALVPTITITGVSVNPASLVANDFTNPRTYIVTAADASTQSYTVTVTPAKSYYWTWYDNVHADNWVLAANPNSAAADVFIDMSVAGAPQTLVDNGRVVPGGIITPKFAGLMGGPVKATSTTGGNAILSQRILWPKGGNSLEEVLAVNETDLSDHYYWTWYDQQSPGYTDWVLIANPTNNPVTYQIMIAGDLMPTSPDNPGTIPANGKVTPTFAGKMDGPVEVTASDKVIASQRVLSGYGAAFNEVPGIPASELSADYLWTWYDQQSPGMTDWVLVANPTNNPVTYRIKIGVEFMDLGGGQTTGTIPAHGKVTPTFAGKMDGPVEVTSTGGNVIASQRVIAGPSFEEVPGYPTTALTTDYHWTWYDMKSAGATNWVLVANPTDTPVTYQIKIAGSAMPIGPSNPGTIPSHSKVTPLFPGTMNGPVEVTANGNVMVSQRVLWNGYFNETLGTVLNEECANWQCDVTVPPAP